jgi:DNA-directed RNA polymerase subunit L
LVVWSYNIRIHYEQNHPNNDLPEIYLLKNDEVEKLKALKFK